MKIDIIKEELINIKINELNEIVESEDQDLTRWESVLLDTLEWIAFGDENSIPTFMNE